VSAREPLTLGELGRLAEIGRETSDPRVLFAAADALVRRTIGHTLFTVTRVRGAAQEVERVYTTDAGAYPVGGRKQKRDTPWSRIVLGEGRVFVAHTPDEIREAFPDHELILSLGIGSIMNVPITAAGRRVGVMNVSHAAGWFRAVDVEAARAVAALLAPALAPR
jgi:GAF domain-containing protein